jgi:hypothetical protein
MTSVRQTFCIIDASVAKLQKSDWQGYEPAVIRLRRSALLDRLKRGAEDPQTNTIAAAH